MLERQVVAAKARSAGVSGNCTSFSASAIILGVISGPTPGLVPKAGGAPGVGGCCCGSCGVSVAARGSAAAAIKPREDFFRKLRRELDMKPPVELYRWDCIGNLALRKPARNWLGLRRVQVVKNCDCTGNVPIGARRVR